MTSDWRAWKAHSRQNACVHWLSAPHGHLTGSVKTSQQIAHENASVSVSIDFPDQSARSSHSPESMVMVAGIVSGVRLAKANFLSQCDGRALSAT